MAKKLFVNLNMNPKLDWGGYNTYALEIHIDGVCVGRLTSSGSVLVSEGIHALHLEFTCVYYDQRYATFCDGQCVVEDSDLEYTVNVYSVTKEIVDFVEGNEPYDPNKTKSQGCYVATCVYGSYDCSEVWVLRRYRDNTLASTWHGRLFIRVYYAISPGLVRWFGHTGWFKKLLKPQIDKMVKKLQARGVADTPYQD